MAPERRNLQFQVLDDALVDVDRLLKGGYVSLGCWTLGQAAWHLAAALQLSVDHPAPVHHDPSRFASAEVKQAFFQSGRIGEGRPIPEGLLPPPAGLDDHVEASRLRDVIAHYKQAPGPVAEHPILGLLTRAEWDRFHCIHCAHHLGNLLPVDDSSIRRPL